MISSIIIYTRNSKHRCKASKIDDLCLLFIINKNARSLVNADLLDLWNEDLKQSHDGLQRKFALPLIYPVAGRYPLINVINIVDTRLLGYTNTTLLHIE